MGVEKIVADRANALREAELKGGRESKHQQKEDKSIHTERRRPKGINLREGQCRGDMTPPPRANS